MGRAMTRNLSFLVLALPLAGCPRGPPPGTSASPDASGPFAAGAPCAQSSDCVSGLCLGQCCDLTSCGTDPTCGATSCDETGACIYTSGSCGLPFCDTGTSLLTRRSCTAGACVPLSTDPCPGYLICASAQACLSACATSSDCLGLTACDAGSCVPVLGDGSPCSANSACFSDICGPAGTGHCCTVRCATSDALGCAATDCDTSGACIYPSAATACVALACVGHELTEPASCDGQGTCAVAVPAEVDCAPYVCSSATQCGTTCSSDADCVSPGFCDSATECCAGYPGKILEVDGVQGVDQPCCGSARGSAACATIAYSVQLAGKSTVQGLTIHVANPPNGLDWTADAFPIQLSFGVTLSAPGLYFSYPPPVALDASVLHIAPFGSETTTSAVVEGSATQPITVGADSKGATSAAGAAIKVDSPMTLFLLNASIQNADCCSSGPFYSIEITGIAVSGGATLTLGTDGNGGSGVVLIGSADNGAQGEPGIYCAGTDSQHLAVVNDQGSQALRSVQFRDEVEGIDAEDYCSVDLSINPLFGEELKADGTCPYVAPIMTGLWIYGNASLNLSNATFQCIGRGVFARAGTLALTNSVVEQTYSGLQMQNAALDLSGGGNTMVCNLDPHPTASTPGYGVSLSAAGSVNLEGTIWNHWDAIAGHTEIWTCDPQYVNCTCSGASTCPSGTRLLPNGADIVLTDPTTTVDDANGQLSPNACP